MSSKKVYGTMISPMYAETRLKEVGARITAQRRAVLEILHNNRTHPTAEAVIDQVQERLGCVSPATVYNTMDTLEALGLIRRIEGLENKAHFDPDTSDHQHAMCRKCSKVWDIESPESIQGLPDKFSVEDVIIQGLCADCAKA